MNKMFHSESNSDTWVRLLSYHAVLIEVGQGIVIETLFILNTSIFYNFMLHSERTHAVNDILKRITWTKDLNLIRLWKIRMYLCN